MWSTVDGEIHSRAWMPAWKKITSLEFLPPNRSAPMSRPSVDLPTDGIHFAFAGAWFQNAFFSHMSRLGGLQALCSTTSDPTTSSSSIQDGTA